MKEVKFYCWTWCPYCIRAKELLTQKNIAFDEIVIDHDQKAMENLTAVSGSDSVPQIFVDGDYIGGCDELYQLEKDGKFDEIFRS
ncbi:MAG: glutaredoxin 3 [Tindallia sp. MSAO_Bac2]|nr:MAG: glutaredoxin 3 [Tindallia sp. MSAO_Bac2]